MTTNISKLKAWRDGVSAGESCPPLEALEGLAEGASSDLKNSQHVDSCPHCQAELAMLRSFESSLPSAKDEKTVEWVVAQLQGAKKVPSTSFQVPFWRAPLRMPNLAMAAALALLIGLGISLYVSNRQQRPVLHVRPTEIQDMRSGDIRLTDPSGELTRTPEDFRWTALPNAKSYSVQLFEVDGTVLWSGQTADSVLIATPELKSKIRPGKQLLWAVTALDDSGKPIARSSQGGFRVTPVKRR